MTNDKRTATETHLAQAHPNDHKRGTAEQENRARRSLAAFLGLEPHDENEDDDPHTDEERAVLDEAGFTATDEEARARVAVALEAAANEEDRRTKAAFSHETASFLRKAASWFGKALKVRRAVVLEDSGDGESVLTSRGSGLVKLDASPLPGVPCFVVRDEESGRALAVCPWLVEGDREEARFVAEAAAAAWTTRSPAKDTRQFLS